ncbi:MAG: Mrp/NBP35 family ATP-binding protein, partial [Gammaproteobacteria bacterium]|nr:Mrp/NBP35 family ATP-binding protein [Gammaproteobacteria bacterium]
MPNPIDSFPDPVLGATWGELGAVRRAARLDERWHVDAVLGYPVDGLEESYTRALSEALDDAVVLDLTFAAPRAPKPSGAGHLIAVASGKGGVGKSTTAVNLALGLDRAGAKTGILDADIYGPSQGMMLGIPDGRRPEVRDQRLFVPIRAHGIEAMSMSMLTDERTPMVWRGPMASGALRQLLEQTDWGGLDYLVVDMPPGTGDIQLTLSQQAAVSGVVIVTTPQDIALLDARKGIEMFQKVDIPILGIVENMRGCECGCGDVHHLFVEGGG